jgi:hypothetical protein
LQIEARTLPHSRHTSFVGEIDARVPRAPRHRAIHRAGVDMTIAKPRRDRPRDSSLPCPRRPVDRYNQPLLHARIMARRT